MSPQTRPQPDLPADAGEAGVVPRDDLELPRLGRLILTAGWNLAEALGLPVAGYLIGAMLGGRAVGMVAATGVVWLTVAVRKVATGSVPGLLIISALVLTLQLLTTAVTIGGVVAGAFLSAVWFARVLRRLGLHVRFTEV